jgi:DNA-binding MurR/RpiR family transcriptional regulator
MDKLEAFRQRLEQNYPSFTKSEQRIASYVLSDYNEAAFLSAAELAQRMEVSEATVVRFAQSLGFSGFPEFRQHLQELFVARVDHAAELRKSLSELNPEADPLEQVIRMEIEYLSDALRTVSREAFNEAARLICNGRRLFVYSLSGSAILAELFEHRLRRFGMDVVPVTQTGREVCDKLLALTGDDVVLAILFHRISKVSERALAYARSCGCKVILLTDSLAPHLRDRVDVYLEARRGPVMAFRSLIVPLAVSQALMLAVARANEQRSMATLNRLDELRTRLGFTE